MLGRMMQNGSAQVKPLPSMLSNAPYEHLLPAVEQAALEAMKLQHTMGSGTALYIVYSTPVAHCRPWCRTQLGCESMTCGLVQLWVQLTHLMSGHSRMQSRAQGAGEACTN